jgi:hypothetical protein
MTAHLPDSGRALDAFRVQANIALAEQARWHVQWDVEKWDEAATAEATRLLGGLAPQAADFHALGIKPFEVARFEKNLLTTAGITAIVTLLTAGTGNRFLSTTARVGVGNGAGTAAIGDTDLSASAGSTNRWFQTCTVTSPSNVLTFAATFGTADGNFAWNEFGIDLGTATVTSGNTVGTTLVNHKTSIAQGTKASGQTWAATATITIS